MAYEREGPHIPLDMRSLIAAWVVYLVLLLGTAIVSEVYISTRNQVGHEFASEHALRGERFDSLLDRHFPDNRQIASDSTQFSPSSE